jgi:hypothetical protein
MMDFWPDLWLKGVIKGIDNGEIYHTSAFQATVNLMKHGNRCFPKRSGLK